MLLRNSVLTAMLLPCWLSGALAAPMPAPNLPPNAASGRYQLSIQSLHAGTEEYTTNDHRTYNIEVKLTLPSLKLHEVAKAVYSNGHVVSAQVTATPGGSATLSVKGKSAAVILHGAVSKTETIPWSTNTNLFGNFMPSLATPLLQNVHLKVNDHTLVKLLILDSVTPLTATLARKPDLMPAVIQPPTKVLHYVLTIAGAIGNVDIDLYSNADNELLLWYVPSQQYLAVRTGSEALAAAILHKKVSLATTPKVRVLDNVQIPMRDGITLAATVTMPAAPGRFPVILERTPYGRANTLDGPQFAADGYAVVVEDVRGRYQSQGTWLPFMNEANDGEDTVKWCAAQPWSNGKVGMFGASYGAYVQWAAAQNHVGALKCILPIVSPPSPLMNIPYEGGELALENDVWWAAIADGRTNGAIKSFSTIRPFYVLPLTSLAKAVLGRSSPIMQWWLAHPPSSSVWNDVDFNRAMKHMAPLPALMVSGWFDGDGIGTDLNFHDMVASGHKNQHVIFGPWTHAVASSTHFQGRNFGQASILPLHKIYLECVNYWLKGDQNAIQKMPTVQAFIMGLNQWRSFSAWPPRRAELQKWYFHTGVKSSLPANNLSTLQPHHTLQRAQFTYNPARPVTQEFLALPVNRSSGRSEPPGFLRFISAPLTKPLIVAGPLTVKLWASSSARDTDWIAVLEDLPPTGAPFFLARGIVRAKYRNGFAKPTAIAPGKPVEYNLNLWATGNAFMPGHRIEVIVTSSLFPDFARNMNTTYNAATAVKMVTARQKVYCSRGHHSYIVLPVVPAEPRS